MLNETVGTIDVQTLLAIPLLGARHAVELLERGESVPSRKHHAPECDLCGTVIRLDLEDLVREHRSAIFCRSKGVPGAQLLVVDADDDLRATGHVAGDEPVEHHGEMRCALR